MSERHASKIALTLILRAVWNLDVWTEKATLPVLSLVDEVVSTKTASSRSSRAVSSVGMPIAGLPFTCLISA